MKELFSFLPYYEELTVISRAGIALLATFIGGFSMFIWAVMSQTKISFDKCFCFSLFASTILWLVAFSKVIKIEYIIFISVFIISLPVLKAISKLSLKDTLYLWFSYLLSQILLLAVIYYNLNK